MKDGQFSRADGMEAPPRAFNLTGGEGIWTFVFADLTIFALMFMTFASYWPGRHASFLAAQGHLHRSIGLTNTLILLTSSWCVAISLARLRSGARPQARAFLMFAAILGGAFVVAKTIEYRSLIAEGITPNSNDFFMFYFVMTGMHLIHCLIGIVVLLVVRARIDIPEIARDRHSIAEAGGIYWHMVDLIWIVIFPLLYLVHR